MTQNFDLFTELLKEQKGDLAPVCRGICAIPTNSMNKTFATFSRALKKDRYLELSLIHI